MTYNFDPDRWLENEIAFHRNKLARGEISVPEYEQIRHALEQRHEAMWQRLGPSYQLPSMTE